MQVYNANYWEETRDYLLKKESNKKNSILKKAKAKQEKQKKKQKQKHNRKMEKQSTCYAEEMRAEPSFLERRMQQFLDRFGIQYEFQKVLDIKRKDGYIKKFYIADFYIPSKNLIIETDGAFHDNQVEYDENRTKYIQKQYPNIKVLRWRWHDFDSYAKVKNLLLAVR